MIATCKKLVTDIQRDKDLDTKLPEYAELLGRQYNCYATVKGSMNYYTMKEVCDEQEDKNMDVCKYFALLTGLLDRHLVKREAVDEDSMEAIAQLRSNVEYKMHLLTAYTDAYEKKVEKATDQIETLGKKRGRIRRDFQRRCLPMYLQRMIRLL